MGSTERYQFINEQLPHSGAGRQSPNDCEMQGVCLGDIILGPIDLNSTHSLPK